MQKKILRSTTQSSLSRSNVHVPTFRALLKRRQHRRAGVACAIKLATPLQNKMPYEYIVLTCPHDLRQCTVFHPNKENNYTPHWGEENTWTNPTGERRIHGLHTPLG